KSMRFMPTIEFLSGRLRTLRPLREAAHRLSRKTRKGRKENSGPLFVFPFLIAAALAIGAQHTAKPVSVAEDTTTYTLSNQYVTARVSKQSGDLVSLRYKDKELLSAGSGHPYGYWSHAPAKGAPHFDTITIDPSKNGGERAEISIKGLYQDQT